MASWKNRLGELKMPRTYLRLAVIVGLALAALGCGGQGPPAEPGEGDPALSRDGKWIAFTSDRAGQGIYVARVGAAARRITDPGENSDGEPEWSPDGSRIVFSRSAERGGSRGVYVVNRDGSALRQLTTNQYDSSPSWSQDGRTIAFSRAAGIAGLSNHIRLVGADGKNERMLLRSGEQPAWSPDGLKIAFVQGLGDAVAVVDLRTRRIEPVTHSKDAGHSAPAWSPEGTQIAFEDWGHFRTETAYEIGIPEIYVVDLDGTNQRRLTRNKEFDWDPTWTADGRIVFASHGGSSSEHLFVMNRDGTGVRRFP